MKTGNKVAIGLFFSALVGGGFLWYNKKKTEQELSPVDGEPTIPTPTKSTSNTAPKPKAVTLDYDSKFTKVDKAHVAIMQKLLGVVADGAWGAKTEAKIPKSLARPFSLNQLQKALIIQNTPIDVKRKNNLDYQLTALAAAPNLSIKQILLPSGKVGYQKDTVKLAATLKSVLAILAKDGYTYNQVAIAYYNKFKRALKEDFNTTGLSGPSKSTDFL